MKLKDLKNFSLSEKTIPWFFFLTTVWAFGLLIPWLGFYQDDWHHIYYFSQGEVEGLKQFLFTDSRPFAFLVYAPFFKILGVNPAGWHISVLILRFLIAFSFWEILNIVWKEEQKRNAIVALFFLIYPAFLLQPMSVMFALHWAMYLVYMLSIWAMLKALDNPRYFSILMVISLLLEIAHLLMLEYFVGLEFLRPFLIFAIFKNKSLRERLISTLKTSFPFLLILGIYIAFRLSFAETFSYDRNTPVILYQLFEEPLKTIVYLFQTMLQDFSEILITAWYGTIEPALFSFSRISNLIVWGNVLVFTIFFVLYFSKLREPENKKKKPDDWAKGMILLGLISVLLGVLPGWAVGKTVHTSNPLWNDRFTMASLFGAGMVWVGLIYKFFRKESHIILILGIMISLAIGTNMRTAFQYKASWEKQSRFYWELFWRAPEIESKTALLADSEFLFFMGVYPTSFAINTLYQSNDNLADMNYWLYVSNERLGKWEDFRAGNTLEYQKYASDFRGSSLNSFAILFLVT